MLDLTRVTLVTATTRDYVATRKAINRCLRHAHFHNVVVFTDDASYFKDCKVIQIPKMTGRSDVGAFHLLWTPNYLDLYADFTLTVHWDSWIVNPDAWTDDFFDYDYIGATWPASGVVGNDGFCLKSRSFHEAVRQLPITTEDCAPSDAICCLKKWPGVICYRDDLEWMGMQYAPPAVADRFSTEDREYNGSFGVHGIHMLAQLVRLDLL